MVILMFKNLDIPEGFTHKASDWQIATDKYFRKDSIVAESKNDTVHLTSILFDINLDPDKIYYARARVIMDYGPSDWSDVDIIKTEDLNKINYDNIDVDIDIPSVIAKPDVSVDFPPDQVPPTFFKIKTSPMSTNTGVRHMATDYIITDLLGNVVYAEFNDTSDLTSHLVFNIMLPEDNFYLVKASHIASSGDVSPLGQQLIYVPGNDIIKVKSNLTSDNASKVGMDIELEPVDDIKKIYVTVYMVGYDEPVEVFSTTEDKFIFDLPKEIFKNPKGTYLMSISYEFIDGNKTTNKYFKIIAD